MLQKQPKFYTPEEYLAPEEKADHKSEYYPVKSLALEIPINRIYHKVDWFAG